MGLDGHWGGPGVRRNKGFLFFFLVYTCDWGMNQEERIHRRKHLEISTNSVLFLFVCFKGLQCLCL